MGRSSLDNNNTLRLRKNGLFEKSLRRKFNRHLVQRDSHFNKSMMVEGSPTKFTLRGK